MGRATKKLTAAIFIAGIFMVAFPGPASAADPANPDLIQVTSVLVSTNITAEHDFVLVFHYNIYYSGSTPNETAQDIFIFSLLSTDGSEELGAVLPYPYYNAGFDQGASAVYFNAFDAPTWGQAYILRIAGNPAYFNDPPILNYYLASSDYWDSGNQTENQAYMGDYILNVADDLEVQWDTELTEQTVVGTVLSETGEAYFRGAIPGLQVMCPNIFYVRAISPTYEERAWATTQSDVYQARFQDTFVGDALDAAGGLFNVEARVISGGFILAAIIGTMIICQVKFGNTTPGLIAGGGIFVFGAVMGWVSGTIMGITGLLFALYIGYTLFFKSA